MVCSTRLDVVADDFEPIFQITALEEVCGDSLVLIDTHSHADNVAWGHQSELIKPDMTAYPPSYNPRIQKDLRINDITRAEFFWEFKLAESCDGFDDNGIQEDDDGAEAGGGGEVVGEEDNVDEEDDIYEKRGPQDKRRYFEKRTKSARDTRNQMATYAGAIMSSQFRTHLFSVQVTRTRARLIRWDREGAVVTNAFPFAEQPYLVEFVKRFAKAKMDYRGHDSCMTEVDRARAKEVREFLRDNNDPNHSEEAYRVYKFTFPNERAGGKPVTFYGGKIAFEGNACPTGRSTRGFLVVDKDNKKAYLKDTWRISKQGMEKEGDVYKILEEKKVEKIPSVVACGDANGKWQETATGSLSRKPDAKRRPHRHYFIVLDTIGRRLTEFRTLRELLNAMKDALQAYYEACTKANILHRDISVGHILITEGGGILIDWDLSRASTSKTFDSLNVRVHGNSCLRGS
ncbi:hypothetical protein L218DRAFT_505516 [Marasmius fiardii PR-910]|nr:hypothetical protein L218DRAFT_505516 [Marasmius fiardii PR-910]